MTEEERIGAEVDTFLVDRRHLDYIECEGNQALLLNYLAVSAASLHAAYEALADELELTPRAEPIYVEQPTPAPSQSPAPVPTAPQIERAKRAIAWRNGKAIEMGSPQRIG
jgi:hypothetical protein